MGEQSIRLYVLERGRIVACSSCDNFGSCHLQCDTVNNIRNSTVVTHYTVDEIAFAKSNEFWHSPSIHSLIETKSNRQVL